MSDDQDGLRPYVMLPCVDCGQLHIEFSIDSDVWNLVNRPDGHETDREYLCLSCFVARLKKWILAAIRARDEARQEIDETLALTGGYEGCGPATLRDLADDYLDRGFRLVDALRERDEARQERDDARKKAEIEAGYRRAAMETRQLLTDRASVAESALAAALAARTAKGGPGEPDVLFHSFDAAVREVERLQEVCTAHYAALQVALAAHQEE